MSVILRGIKSRKTKEKASRFGEAGSKIIALSKNSSGFT
jgi:hypothetical protein